MLDALNISTFCTLKREKVIVLKGSIFADLLLNYFTKSHYFINTNIYGNNKYFIIVTTDRLSLHDPNGMCVNVKDVCFSNKGRIMRWLTRQYL